MLPALAVTASAWQAVYAKSALWLTGGMAPAEHGVTVLNTVWRFPVTGPAGAFFSGFAGSPAMTAGRVVFGAVDGQVYAFDGEAR